MGRDLACEGMESSEQKRFIPIIRERLGEIRKQLESGAEDREAVSPDKSIGRLSRLDSMQMQQMALAGKRRLEEEIRDLEEALKRIATGRYGTCGLCGRDIARERLEYQLAAVSCVRCLERQGRP